MPCTCTAVGLTRQGTVSTQPGRVHTTVETHAAGCPCSYASLSVLSCVLVCCCLFCRFLTPTFFTLVCFLTPLQFAFQAGRLTQPTCDALLSSPYGPGALQQLLQTLERVSQWALHGTTHPSTSIVLDTAQGCRSLLYLLQLFSGGTMLYVQYRMERTNRVAYLQGRHKLAGSWPRMRTLVQAVLHALVYLQLFAVAWVLQGASGSRGSGAPGTGPLAAAPGAAVFGAGSLSV